MLVLEIYLERIYLIPNLTEFASTRRKWDVHGRKYGGTNPNVTDLRDFPRKKMPSNQKLKDAKKAILAQKRDKIIWQKEQS